MTDQTVPVPVDLLQELASRYHNYSDPAPYAVTSAMPTYVASLVSLIPTPPKVGDVVESAEVARKLPVGTILRDNEQDVWVVTEGQHLHYVRPWMSAPHLTQIDNPAFNYFTPVILALPDNA